MLDPPTHNRPFANKPDKVGMDGVPKFLNVRVGRNRWIKGKLKDEIVITGEDMSEIS